MAMWSFAREDLGLTFKEFWRLSPRMFAALVRRHKYQIEIQDYRAGVIAATFTNVVVTLARSFRSDGKNKPKEKFKAATPQDFFYLPTLAPKPATHKSKNKSEKQGQQAPNESQTWQQQLAVIQMLNAAFGGDIKDKPKER